MLAKQMFWRGIYSSFQLFQLKVITPHLRLEFFPINNSINPNRILNFKVIKTIMSSADPHPGGGPAHGSRTSTERERDSREKSQSQSEERTIPSKGIGSGIEVEDNSQLAQALSQYDLEGFQIRPKFGERFSSVAVEQMIEVTLKEYFHSERKRYHSELAEEWVAEIGRILVGKMRTEFSYPRYKFVTHVVVGEKIGGGIHIGMKCLWDADSDSYATYTYITDYLFCVATICAIFFY